jgi:hypothetical protein
MILKLLLPPRITYFLLLRCLTLPIDTHVQTSKHFSPSVLCLLSYNQPPSLLRPASITQSQRRHLVLGVPVFIFDITSSTVYNLLFISTYISHSSQSTCLHTTNSSTSQRVSPKPPHGQVGDQSHETSLRMQKLLESLLKVPSPTPSPKTTPNITSPLLPDNLPS